MNPSRWLVAYTLAVCTLWAGTLSAAESSGKSAAQLLPPTTLVYVELGRPGALLDLLDGPAAQKLLATPQYQKVLSTPQAEQGKMLLTLLEGQLGTNWRQVLRTLTDGGVYMAFDPITQGVVTLIRTSDATMRDRLIETLIQGARSDAANNGRPDPIQDVEYQGFTGYKSAAGGMISVGPWLLLTNQEVLARWMIDAYKSPTPTSSLADDSMFKSTRARAAKDGCGWAFAKIGTLRMMGVGQGLFGGKHTNPAAELFLGGVIDSLGRADYATLDLYAGAEGLKLSLAIPHNPAAVAPARKFFFPPAGQGSAPKPLKPEGTMLTFNLYRDFGAMWLAAPDLFDENVATQLAQADSGLSNFFGGRSFSQDILGNILPRFQFIVARQEFKPTDGPTPAIKLPAFGLVFQVKDAPTMKQYMQLAFNTVVSIANINATMQGAPALMINNETRDGTTLSTASYLSMPDQKAMTDGPLYFNFTPSMSLVSDYVIITSTRGLAEKLAVLAAKPAETVADNTLLEIDAAPILAGLKDNRNQLVSLTMIQQGVDKAKAEQMVELGMEAMAYLRGVELRLVPESDRIRLDLGFKLNTTK